MSLPEPMPCLAEHCPTPTQCNARGQCREREKDRWLSWWQALDACRSLSIPDPFTKEATG